MMGGLPEYDILLVKIHWVHKFIFWAFCRSFRWASMKIYWRPDCFVVFWGLVALCLPLFDQNDLNTIHLKINPKFPTITNRNSIQFIRDNHVIHRSYLWWFITQSGILLWMDFFLSCIHFHIEYWPQSRAQKLNISQKGNFSPEAFTPYSIPVYYNILRHFLRFQLCMPV